MTKAANKKLDKRLIDLGWQLVDIGSDLAEKGDKDSRVFIGGVLLRMVQIRNIADQIEELIKATGGGAR